MNRVALSMTCILWACRLSGVLAAESEWRGQMVMLKESAAPQVGTRRINSDEIAEPALVEQVRGDWLWIGVAWVKTDDALLLDEAPAYFTKLIDRGKNPAKSHMMRGISRLSLNEFENAVDDFNAALRLDPRNVSLYCLRGNAHYGRHANDAALADFDVALRLDPKNLIAMNGRGCALNGKGELGKSLKQLNEALRLDARNALTYSNRAGTWYDLEQFDKSLADLNRAIQLDPKLAIAYSNRGRWYARHGDYTKAITDYEQAIRLAPREWSPYVGLARIYATAPAFQAHIRNGKLALDMAKKACDLSLWDDWTPIAAMAAAYAELGDFEAAVRWQTKAMSMPQSINNRDGRTNEKRLALYRAGKAYYEDVFTVNEDTATLDDKACKPQ